MALLVRFVTNTSSLNPISLEVPGFDPTNLLTISPSATVDLLSVMSESALHAMQAQLNSLIFSGELISAGTIDSSVLYPAAMLSYVASSDTKIVFNPTSGSASHTVGFTVLVQVENAAGAIDVFDDSTTVVVTATPTGSSVPMLNGHASPITVTMLKGVASVLVTANIADTETLSLSSPSRSLAVTSTSIITLS